MSLSLEQASVQTTVLLPADAAATANGNSGPAPQQSTVDHVFVRLDTQEVQVLETLLNVAMAFENGQLSLPANKSEHHAIQVRIAGGWVRDKLLGIDSHDIDITLDNVTGVEFATLVQQYIREHSPDHYCPKMGVIAANPSQSKHLETATMKIHGLEVDFANLRTNEVYQDHSRIPTTEFGTPLEDAQRRDFTLNALFYNLRTNQVEDWTGRGLSDLFQSRVLATPLPPLETFRDDPLRVLRAIRFAVRLDLALAPELEATCKSPLVHERMIQKVSRERVGKELEGMLNGKGAKPGRALDMIGHLELATCVFPFFADLESHHLTVAGLDPIWDNHARILLHYLPGLLQAHEQVVTECPSTSIVDTRLLHLAVFVSPFRHSHYTDPNKGTQVCQVEYMIREGLKFKNKDANGIMTVMQTLDRAINLLTESSRSKSVSRLDAGLWVRDCKELWVNCLLVATCCKIYQEQQQGGDSAIATNVQLCTAVYREIVRNGLDLVWKTKPLMNGKDVTQVLGIPYGPLIGVYIEEQFRWRLLYPNGTRDECEQHLRRFTPGPIEEKEKPQRKVARSAKWSYHGQR